MSNAPWFDREEILTSLTRRVEGFLAGYRQNCALLGPEAVGKTTLLKRFLQTRVPRSSLVTIYMEVGEGDSFTEWVVQFVQSVLCGLLHARDAHPAPEEFSRILQVASLRFPQACADAAKIVACAEAGRYEEVFDKLWDLPRQVTQEAGIPCLLVLDEFHRLQRFPVKEPFGRLGRSIMSQSTTMYLVASSSTRVARSILQEGLNLLFGKFEIVEMGPLDPTACLQAIRSVWPLEAGDPFLECLLIELAQGYPGCLDLLLQGVLDRRLADPHEDQERIVLDTLESQLLEPRGILRQRFEERVRSLPTHRSRLTWIQTLAAVARGSHRVPQIANTVGRSLSQVVRSLRVLEQAGLVAKQGVFYRVPDRLFQLWMDTAFPLLRGAGLTDPNILRARFRDSVWAWMMKAREAIHQPIEEQVAALLKSWAGELVEIGRHKILLPAFNRVERLGGPTGRFMILAHRTGPAGKSWLVIPWAGFLDESQARSIAQWVLHCAGKPHRKVLVGAHPIEMNARLILQEAQIRLWDLSVLNSLLDLYGLARISLPSGVRSPLAQTHSIIPEAAPTPADTQLKKVT